MLITVLNVDQETSLQTQNKNVKSETDCLYCPVTVAVI